MEINANNQNIDVGKRLEELRNSITPSDQDPDEIPEKAWIQNRLLDLLRAQAKIQETTFSSNIPILGTLIGRFRQAWNNVSTTWYVRPMVEQQNEFNRLLIKYLVEMEEIREEMDARLIAIDREGTSLAREIARIKMDITQLEQSINNFNQGQPEN